MNQQPCIYVLYQIYAIFAALQMFLDQRNGILVSSLISVLSAKHLVAISFHNDKINVLVLACDLTVNNTLDQCREHFVAPPRTHSFPTEFQFWPRGSSSTLLSATLAAMLFVALSCDYRSMHGLVIRFIPPCRVWVSIRENLQLGLPRFRHWLPESRQAELLPGIM